MYAQTLTHTYRGACAHAYICVHMRTCEKDEEVCVCVCVHIVRVRVCLTLQMYKCMYMLLN